MKHEFNYPKMEIISIENYNIIQTSDLLGCKYAGETDEDYENFLNGML